MRSLGGIPGLFDASGASAISADGNVVVGYVLLNCIDEMGKAYQCRQAYRWTERSGFELLGVLEGDEGSSAEAVSSDGSTVIGNSFRGGITEETRQAFIWTAGSGMRKLSPLPGGAVVLAGAMSADARTLAGATAQSGTFFVWRDGVEAILLNDGIKRGFPCGTNLCVAVAGDGSRVAWGGAPPIPIWDSRLGFVYLEDELRSHGIDPEGWELYQIGGISGDGSVLVGKGVFFLPEVFPRKYRQRAWVARIVGCRDPQEVPVIVGAPSSPVSAFGIVGLVGASSTSGPGETSPVSSYKWRIKSGLAEIVGSDDEAQALVRGLAGGGPVTVTLTVDDGVCENPATARASMLFCSQERQSSNARLMEVCTLPTVRRILLSGDGSTLFGSTIPGPTPDRGRVIRWTASGGWQLLDRSPDGILPFSVHAVSRDGGVIVGEATVPHSADTHAYRWTPVGGVEDLGATIAAPGSSRAEAVDAAGIVVAGTGPVARLNLFDPGPVLWRSAVEPEAVPIGSIPGGFHHSGVLALSSDGSALFLLASSQGPLETLSFRWTETDGLRSLGDLSGSIVETRVSAVSSDGTVAVGSAWSTRGLEAVIWSESRGLRAFGDWPGGLRKSDARAVSGDGHIVVGSWTGQDGVADAFWWTEETGLRRLLEVFQSDYGLDLTGWMLSSADAISEDGLTIAGFGQNPGGGAVVWIADLDICGDPGEVASIKPLTAGRWHPGDEIVLDGRGSSAGRGDAGSVTHRWEVDRGPGEILEPSNQPTARLRALDTGTVVVRLTVDDGRCSNASTAVASLDVTPIPDGNWLLCDANADGRNDIADPVFTLRRLFLGGPEAECPPSADCNSDGRNDVSDSVFNLRVLFGGGVFPVAPYPDCAVLPGCERRCR